MPLPSPSSTPTPGPAELDKARAYRQAVGPDLRGKRDGRERIQALADAVVRYLQVASDPARHLAAQPALTDALRQSLTLPGQRDALSGKPASATVVAATLGAQDAVIVALGAPGAPALAFLRSGADFRPYALSPLRRQPGTDLQPIEGLAAVDRVEDVNGDGQSEIVVVETTQGGSSSPVHVGILQWSPAVRSFRSLFAQMVSNWAGPASWKLVPRDGKQDVVLQAPLFGPFDHKLLPHQQETRVYRWDGTTYALAERRATPPEYRRQQANLGEAAFRCGACEEAITAYRQVIDDPALKPDEGGPAPDWVGFAWFRIGECSAILGREADARAALEKARSAGSDLGDLAGRFLSGYQGGDVARGLAAPLQSDLPKRLYEGTPGNVTFPMDAPGLLYPGAALAAFARTRPEALQRPRDELLVALKSAGLPTTQALTGDLDGDGAREMVAVIPVGDLDTVWLVSNQNSRWVGLPVFRSVRSSGAVRLDGPFPLDVEGKARQGFAVLQGPQSRTDFTLDGQTVLLVAPGAPGGPARAVTPVDTSEFPWEFHLE